MHYGYPESLVAGQGFLFFCVKQYTVSDGFFGIKEYIAAKMLFAAND